jgi:hypothetical protein
VSDLHSTTSISSEYAAASKMSCRRNVFLNNLSVNFIITCDLLSQSAIHVSVQVRRFSEQNKQIISLCAAGNV